MGHEPECTQPDTNSSAAPAATYGPGPGLAATGNNIGAENGTRRVTLQVSIRQAKRAPTPAMTDGCEGLPEYALYFIRKENPVRKAALWVTTNKYFDWFILLTILANCVELALYSHRPGFDQTALAQILDIAEYCFLVVFGTEMVLKIIAMGFAFEAGTYLRSGWNVLDASVVVLGIIDAAMTGPSYSALRAVRVLRPLRTITHIKGLRVPVVTLLHALPQLVDVGILCGFALLIFGIVGVQMFAGALRNRCAAAHFSYATALDAGSGSLVYSNVSYLLPLGSNQLCSGYLSSDITWTQTQQGFNSSSTSPTWQGGEAGGGFVCSADPNPAADAPFGMFCAPFQNPNSGMTSFDNVLWAWITIFQCITQEGWTDIMYAVWDAVSPGTLVYFVVLIIFGSFFLINLALAVLYLQFTKEFSVTPAASRSVSLRSGAASQTQQLLPEDSNIQPDQAQLGQRVTADDYDDDATPGLPAYAVPSPRSTGCNSRPISQVGFLLEEPGAKLLPPEFPGKAAVSSIRSNSIDSAADAQGMIAGVDDYVTAQVILASGPTPADTEQEKMPQTARSIMKQESCIRSLSGSLQDESAEAQQRLTCSSAWAAVRRCCKLMVEDGWFGLVNILVILANTAVMATTSYPMDPGWADTSETVNVAFSIYFATELVLKVTAMGPRAYIRDRMNQFDALVVVASLVEIIMMLVPGGNGMASLSVLRTARLMRVFKLARSWRELNRIITTILHSFSQVMYLSILVLLFVFIFALMGMQLFGYSFGSCTLPDAQQVCPPGVVDCPDYPDCYVPCDVGHVFTWVPVQGSPYNGQAFCEQFPRSSSYSTNATAAAAADAIFPLGTFQYWAQVGKANVPDSRFDNIGWALLTVFQLVTTENWNNVMYNAMTAMNPAISLWFIAAIIIGNYILLNLFLAILLENFSMPSTSDGSGSRTSRMNSNGSTLAAAVKMAMIYDWLQDLLECSWFARMLHGNRIHAMPQPSGNWDTVDADGTVHHPDASTPPSLGLVSKRSGDEGGRIGVATPRQSKRQLVTYDSFRFATAPAAETPFSSAALMPPARIPVIASKALLGNRSPSFGVARRVSSVTLPNCQSQLADAGLEVQRSSYSSTLLQGSMDLLLARLPTGLQHTGGSMTSASPLGQRMQRVGSRLQQQHAADSRGSMSIVPSVGAGLDAMAQSGGATSMHGATSGYWDGADTKRSALEGYSFSILGPHNWLRMNLDQILKHRHFENAVLLLIFLSSMSLALQMPTLDRDGTLYQVLENMDMVFVALFAAEAFIKALVKGFLFNGEGSYLRNPWNVLDFLIVVIGVVMMAITLGGGDVHSLSSLRALRTLRALRPLRVASRLEGMKVVVNALFASLPPLGNVLLVCVLFYLIFGIMGVHLLAGMLYSCQDPNGNMYDASYVLPPGQYITRDWCENTTTQVTSSEYHAGINVTVPAYTLEKQWVNSVANYDNVLQATLTLFQISTTELWVNTMYQSIAAVGVDQQPRDGANPALALFFVVFIVFGGFFVLQLFVATTIEKFAEMQQKQKKGIMLTARQQEWLAIQRIMGEVKLKAQHMPPENSSWRRAVFRMVMSEHCEFFIMVVIIANVIFLTLTHADMNDSWQAFMSYSNVVFTGIFTLEALLKIIALGLLPYLKDGWCQFDLFVVAVSIVGVAIDLGTTHNLEFLPLIRVMRVARVFKLIPKAQGLRTLLQTLVFSLPALGNVGSVLFLFFFIYAVVGMNLFGSIKYGAYLSDKVNFSHVGLGLLTLFRMITGESWDGIMQDCMVSTGCVEVVQDVLLGSGVVSPTNSSVLAAGTWLNPDDPLLSQIPPTSSVNRCSPGALVAVVYFCSFVLLCGLVLVNFVIGVIIDNMQSSKTSDDMAVSRYHIEQFVKVWSELDAAATHYIPAVDLATLIQELPPPLGVNGEEGERAKIQSIIMSTDIPVRNTKVHFLETLHALAGRIAGTEEPESEEQKVHQRLRPHLPISDPQGTPKYTVAHFYAALYVQAAVRGFLKRHALQGVGVQTVVLRELPRGTVEEEEE